MRRPMLPRAVRLVLASTLALSALSVAAAPTAAPAARAGGGALPDLAMAPLDDFVIQWVNGQRLLRFTAMMVNVGDGQFELRGHRASTGDPMVMDQIIYTTASRSSGIAQQLTTQAVAKYSGDGHDHWHVLDFQKFKLVSLDAEVLGNVEKTGFCSFDSYPYTSPRPPFFTSDRDICQTNASSGKVLMGTSRGWGDIYRWSIAFQWIDITDLPDGRYKVRVVVDAPYATGGFFREADESNNRSWTKIRIKGSNVTILDQSRDP